MVVSVKKTVKNRGAALITVMVIVFVVMAIITNLTIKNYRVIRRLINQNVQQQADGLLSFAVNFSRAALATTASTSSIDTINDIWAQPLPKTKAVGDFTFSGYILDEQGKFNINDLVVGGNVNPNVLQQFTQLLTYLNIPAGMASNIALYMASPGNEQNIITQYTSGNPPYRPAGKPLIDLSELMLVQGMQSAWLYKLSQYVTVIPQPINYLGLNAQESSESGNVAPPPTPQNLATNFGSIQVNVNTATAEVIAAKSGIPLPIAQRMTTTRNDIPFKSSQDITTFLSSNGIILSQSGQGGGSSQQQINPSTLTTQTSYFTVHAVVDDGDYQFTWVALLYRPNRSGQWPQVLWQHPE